MLFFAVYFFQRRKGRVRLKKYIITTLILLLLIAGVVGMVLLRSGEGTPAQAAEFTPAPCTHETWADGACESCALRCVHRAWEEGLCTRCGWGCPHEQWLPNACARCGIACPHDVYDRDKHGCLRCGVELSHRYAGYRCERLPANLLQAQRDYFGAHTYERLDAPRGEFFHTNWTGEGGSTSASTYNA